MIKIVTAPDNILSQKAKKIARINKSILDFTEEMKKALLAAKDPEGVGLAAPQVGKSLSIFITKASQKSPIRVFINPTVKIDKIDSQTLQNEEEKKDTRKTVSKRLEGCLSLPSIWGHVKRSSGLTLSYLDEKGKSHAQKFSGFMATIIQHEMDHLDGILFTKRVLEQKGTMYKSHKDENGEDVFEEIEI